MMLCRTTLVSVVLVFVVLGCQHQPPPPQTLWKGTVHLSGQKDLTFFVYLDLGSQIPSGFFLNGSEKTPIPEVYFHGDSLDFNFSEYGSDMHSVWKDGRFVGAFYRYRKDTVINTFEATPFQPQAAPAQAKLPPNVMLVGKFQTYINGTKGMDSTSTANFWARGDSVFGTIIAPDGDYGLMAGKQIGDTVIMGRFTGWQGQLMELIRQQNTWIGTVTYRMPPQVSFSLEPRTALPAELPGVKKTTPKDPRKSFLFSGVTIMGDTLTNLDARFKGKALIVDIMGTWCHNCMDASPLLQRLYAEFGRDGLEVVGLSFELRDDPQVARKNMLLYEERYGLTYPVLFCGSTDDKNVEARLRSQLENFGAYPTAIFVDKKGKIEYIHSGFSGPGAGDEYQGQINLYYELARKLVGKVSASR